MTKGIVFVAGAAAGALGGVVVTLALQGGDPAEGLEPGGAPATQRTEPAPNALPKMPGAPAPETPVVQHDPDAASAPAPAEQPRPEAESDDAAAARAALAEAMAKAVHERESKMPTRREMWRNLAREMVDWDPASAKYQEYFRQALADLSGGDRRAAMGAGYALGWAGMQQRFSDAQLEELHRTLLSILARSEANGTFTDHLSYRGLTLDPPIAVTDAPGWIAYILAAGWSAQPEKLKRLTERIEASRHPTVHLGVLTAFQRRVDDLHRRYVARLTRHASDERVLQRAWNGERLARIANGAWAAEFLGTLEGRLVRWDLGAPLRAKGWRAGIECGLRSPERGSAMLRVGAASEPDTGNRDFAKAAGALLEGGLIDGAAVDALARKHPPSGQ